MSLVRTKQRSLLASLVATVMLAGAGCAHAPGVAVPPHSSALAARSQDGTFLVRLKAGQSPQAWARRHGVRHLAALGLNMHRMGGGELASLARDAQVAWLEPESSLRLPPSSGRHVTSPQAPLTSRADGPDDPLLPAQYAWRLLGADRTWRAQPGRPEVLVAVIDSGIDVSHPDLMGQAFEGWDLTGKVAGPGGLVDGYGHGTHVAGVIGARVNNGVGIAGLAPGCKLLPVRIFNNFGHSTSGASAAAIVWAVDHGAKVINASWGSPMQSQAMTDALAYAADKDVIVVAAAGNSGNNEPKYPGAEPLAVGVAASNDIDGWASFSTFGDWVDLAAPGEGVLSTYPLALGNGYRIMRGTSMAAPHVTAAAALLRSQHPSWSREQVIERLYVTAKDIVQTGMDPYAGRGRVDLLGALGLSR
ncbi:MAG: S8 family serine peptidase [Candidatus Sericytochromatia bacterium]|nr:S8 family serine peptidase [Candidatus Sericytochromatia bacterium]